MAYEARWLKNLRKRAPRLVAKYQKPKVKGEGERLPDFVHVTGYESFRLDVPKPGAYVKCVGPSQDGHDWPEDMASACARCGVARDSLVGECSPVSWWLCDPHGHWLACSQKGYEVFEHEDGTITVSEMVENPGPYDDVYTGMLRRGIWSPPGEAA